MNYYPFHIGDFNNSTRRWSVLQRAFYREMIDLYYDKEGPLTNDFDELCEDIMAVTEKEKAIVQKILQKKFKKTADGWHNSRCDKVLAEYQEQVPKDEEKKKNERDRQKRARDKRKQIFNELIMLGKNPKWNDTTEDLTVMLDDCHSHVTRDNGVTGVTCNGDFRDTLRLNQNQNQNQNHIPKPLKNFWETFFTPWNELLPDLQPGSISSVERAALMLSHKHTDDEIIGAIRNYAAVLNSNKHFYTHRHTLEKFLKSHVPQFLDSMKPLENFLIVEKPAAKNSEANEVWENVLKLAGNAYSQETYQGLPERTKAALKAVGGLVALGRVPQTLLPRMKTQFVEAYSKEFK